MSGVPVVNRSPYLVDIFREERERLENPVGDFHAVLTAIEDVQTALDRELELATGPRRRAIESMQRAIGKQWSKAYELHKASKRG